MTVLIALYQSIKQIDRFVLSYLSYQTFKFFVFRVIQTEFVNFVWFVRILLYHLVRCNSCFNRKLFFSTEIKGFRQLPRHQTRVVPVATRAAANREAVATAHRAAIKPAACSNNRPTRSTTRCRLMGPPRVTALSNSARPICIYGVLTRLRPTRIWSTCANSKFFLLFF